jgi:signal peptidase I
MPDQDPGPPEFDASDGSRQDAPDKFSRKPRAARRAKKKRSPMRNLLEFVGIFLVAIIVAYFLQAYIVKPFQIPSESMQPTIDPGDRILVNRLAYRYGSVQHGDIIVFKAPTEPGVDFVKRVIALPGDTIEVQDGKAILNGQTLDEPYLSSRGGRDFPSQKVPDGTVFVMGDNRSNSEDARFWPVPWLSVDDIVGKAFVVYWPPSHLGKF